jgi:hypothetical protein
MRKNDYYVLAVDIEASGSSKKRHGIVSIGASVQDRYSNEVANFQVNLSLPEGKEYEEKCIQNFWLKNPGAYKFVQTNTVETHIAIERFTDFLSKVEKDFNQGGKLRVVSDNPRFDVAWLNYYIDEYTDKYTLDHNMFGDFRFIWDINSMMKVLLSITRRNLNANWGLADRLGFKSKWVADHNPLNDARTIADYYNQIVAQMDFLGRAYEYSG